MVDYFILFHQPLLMWLAFMALADIIFEKKIPVFVVLLSFLIVPGVLLLPIKIAEIPIILTFFNIILIFLFPCAPLDKIGMFFVLLFYPQVFLQFFAVLTLLLLIDFLITNDKELPLYPFMFLSFLFCV